MQPTIIQGPAFVLHGSNAIYSQGPVTINYQRETWEPMSANFGGLGKRHRSSRAIVTLTPVGELGAADVLTTKYWTYTPAMIGTSIFGGSNTTLAIVPATGNKVTFARSAILSMPSLELSPIRTALNEMSFVCLGDPAKEPTDAAYFQAIASTTTDTSFDGTKVISPRYTGAWGASPFDTLEPENGFRVQPVMELQEMSPVNYGLTDIILKSLGVEAGFTPVNLTEAQIATMLRLQDTGAVRPGDTYSNPSDDRDLVISGTGLATLTLKHMGAISGGLRYDTGLFRQDAVVMGHRATFTTGARDALWTIA